MENNIGIHLTGLTMVVHINIEFLIMKKKTTVTIKRKINGTFIRLNNGILYTDNTFICNKCIYIVNEIKKDLLKTSVNDITQALPNELVYMILNYV